MVHCDRFKRLITNLLLIATFLLPTKVEAQRTAASQSLVIAGGTLIDGTGNPSPSESAAKSQFRKGAGSSTSKGKRFFQDSSTATVTCLISWVSSIFISA